MKSTHYNCHITSFLKQATLLLLALLCSTIAEGGRVKKKLSKAKNIYLVELSAADLANVRIGDTVDVTVSQSAMIIDGKVIALKGKLAKLKILDRGAVLNKGSKFKITSLNNSGWTNRNFLIYGGTGFSIGANAEYHSSSDLLYGGSFQLLFSKLIEAEAYAQMGFHQKLNGTAVDIIAAGGKLRLYLFDSLNFFAGGRYKIYQENFPTKQKTEQETPTLLFQGDAATTETSITDGYTYHDEDGIYISGGVGMRFDSMKALIGNGFSILIDAGFDYLISEISETIPGYNPLDDDLLGLGEGMSVWGGVTLVYFF